MPCEFDFRVAAKSKLPGSKQCAARTAKVDPGLTMLDPKSFRRPRLWWSCVCVCLLKRSQGQAQARSATSFRPGGYRPPEKVGGGAWGSPPGNFSAGRWPRGRRAGDFRRGVSCRADSRESRSLILVSRRFVYRELWTIFGDNSEIPRFLCF